MTISNSAFCIYGFCIILGLNGDYFLKRHFPFDLCNGEVWCSLWGTDWVPKYSIFGFRGLRFLSNLSTLEFIMNPSCINRKKGLCNRSKRQEETFPSSTLTIINPSFTVWSRAHDPSDGRFVLWPKDCSGFIVVEHIRGIYINTRFLSGSSE
jgi:hypothetical protein